LLILMEKKCNLLINRENVIAQNIMVSVLMTVYRDEEYLEQAIESIINQTYRNFEFIIIKEFGTDKKTEQILEKYQNIDFRINVYSNEKKLGFAASLNRGLDLAKGKYIFRMDGDDISVPNRLAMQIDYMESHPNLLLCGGYTKYLYMDGRKGTISDYPVTSEDIRNSALFYVPFAHPTVCFNRAILDNNNIRYDDEYRAEDYELWSRLVYFYEMENIPQVLLKYRIHGSNTTSLYQKKVDESVKKIQANIVRMFIPEYPREYFGFANLNDDMELRHLEKILYQLFSENRDVFTSTRFLRRKMREVYFELGNNSVVTNPFRRYWKTFGGLEKNNLTSYFTDWIYFKYHSIRYLLGGVL